MAYEMLPEAPEPKFKQAVQHFTRSLKRGFYAGRWGISINLAQKELFLGVVITPVLLQPLTRKPITKQGKAKFIVFEGF